MPVALLLFLFGVLFVPSSYAQPDRKVIIVTLDGFPAYALQDPRLPMPTLRRMMGEGAYADTMQPINPTVTWPNHTAMITGVDAVKHNVLVNGRILFGSHGTPPHTEPWVARDLMVHVPTLYDVASEAGLTTAQVDWVAIYHARHINWSFAELPEPDGEIENDLIARGLVTAEQLKDFNKSSAAWRDQIRIEAVSDILHKHHPNLLLLHLTDLDNINHAYGPMSAASFSSMKALDDRLREIIDAVHDSGDLDKTSIFVVSDHGFRTFNKVVHLNTLLRQRGLIRGEGSKINCDAWLMPEGGSALLYVTNESMKTTIIPQLQALFANAEGVDHVYGPSEFAAQGIPVFGDQAPALYITAKPDYALEGGDTGPLITPSTGHGTHGYSNADVKMGALFVAWGANIRNGIRLETIKNVDITPTAASILKLKMDGVEGRVLKEILR
ncbi:alkaline phosphatase family protein [Terriglobus sp. TAA 43]|uniref:alkaline phosphatase family protein n=1 Tax=Terriglobus sp. TAA 43 TaxID=278961 RepID=UPI0006455D7D|nr:alkaline phosphatase family protein [Terriglobus sp. TAA 43]